jgi:hypothetical protein
MTRIVRFLPNMEMRLFGPGVRLANMTARLPSKQWGRAERPHNSAKLSSELKNKKRTHEKINGIQSGPASQ